MANKRIQCKVLLTLFLIINTCFAGVLMEGDSLLVRENAHIEKLLMLDVTNEAMEADSILVKATDNYICNFPVLKLPFFTESEIDSILLGKADTGHVHDTSDVNSLSLYLGQKLDVTDTSDLARKVHVHDTSDVTGLQDALELKLDVTELNNYYTKTNLETSGQSSVHADNITNAPWINRTTLYWNTLNSNVFNIRADDGPGIPGAATVYGGINVNIGDGYNFQIVGRNDRFFLRSEENSTWLSWREIWHKGNLDPSDYYTKTNLQTSGGSQVHADNITNAPWLTSLPSHDHDTSDVTGLHNMLAGKEPSLGFSDNMSTLRGSDKTWAPVTSMLSLNPPSSPDQYYKYNGSQFVWSDIPISDVTDLQDALELKLDVTDTSVFVRDPELDDYYTKTNLQTSGQASVHAGNINSGTLSNSRLSFNPDYFVQGSDSYRRENFDNSYQFDSNVRSTFFRLTGADPASPDGANTYLGFRTANSNNYTIEVAGSKDTDKLLFGSVWDGVRQPWREIWHEDNLDPSDYALVSHNHDTRYYTKPEINGYGVGLTGYNNVSNFTDQNLAGGLYTAPYNVAGIPEASSSTVLNLRTGLSGGAVSQLWMLGNNTMENKAAIRHCDNEGNFTDWTELYHGGNLDTANIAKIDADNVFTGVNTFDDTVGIKNGIKISDNSNHFFMIGPDLYGEIENDLPSIKFYLDGYSSGYSNTSEQSIKLEADWIRNHADYRIGNSAERIVNSGLSTFSNYNISSRVTNPVHIRNDHSFDSTGAQITFGFDPSITSDYHHAGIKAMRTNKGADHASSIYLQARTPGTSAGPSGLTDIVEAGINGHQAFVKYHNNPPVIHNPDSLIVVNTSLTFNPHRGSYAAYSGSPPQTMTLGSGEPGQPVEFAIIDGTFPLTIVYEGGSVVTEYGKIYKFKYLEGLGWFKYE